MLCSLVIYAVNPETEVAGKVYSLLYNIERL